MKAAVLLLALAVGLFRPVLLFVDIGARQSSYEALAHCLVTGMIVWTLAKRDERFSLWSFVVEGLFGWFDPPSWNVCVASVLIWVELVCFGVKASGVVA